MAKRTVGASEGDAYRYTKKALLNLPNASSVRSMMEEYFGKETSWTRNCYSIIRSRFFMNGISDILFAPGVARIAFGELHMEDNDERSIELQQLDNIIQMISANHRDDYSRHLMHGDRLMTYNDLNKIFGDNVKAKTKDLEVFLESKKYKAGHYKIVPLNDFKTAKKYEKYASKFYGWCHLSSEGTFKNYQRGGFVKLYLALKKGYRKLTPEDPGFGESMLGIDIGPRGELVHVNNRWNHARDNVDAKKGDNKYDAVELSDLLGKPYYKACPPHDREHMISMGCTIKPTHEIVSAVSHGEMVDPRDGQHYKTATIGGVTIMAEDFNYVYAERDYETIIKKLYKGYNEAPGNSIQTALTTSSAIPDVTPFLPDFCLSHPIDGLNESEPMAYNWFAATGFAPDGWHLPTQDDIEKIMKGLGYNTTDNLYSFRLVGGSVTYRDYNIDATLCGIDLLREIGMVRENRQGIGFWMNDRLATLSRDMYYHHMISQAFEAGDMNTVNTWRGRSVNVTNTTTYTLNDVDTFPLEAAAPRVVAFPTHHGICQLPEEPDWPIHIKRVDEPGAFDPTDTSLAAKMSSYMEEVNKREVIQGLINAEKTCRSYSFELFGTEDPRLGCKPSGSLYPVRYVKD